MSVHKSERTSQSAGKSISKSELFQALSLGDRAPIIELAGRIVENHDIVVLKKPQRMLVMLRVRESARHTLFNAAEALACECMVRIGDVKGYAACLGEDLARVYAMAVIDAALNAGVDECNQITDVLLNIQKTIAESRAAEAKLLLSTKVDFSVMEE